MQSSENTELIVALDPRFARYAIQA